MRVLLVDDYEPDAELAKRYLQADRKTSYQVEHCETLDQALAQGRQAEFDVALLDLSLPDSHGLSTFQAFHEALPDLATVVVTGLHDENVALEAVEGGAQDYLVKDELGKGVLVRTLRHAAARKALERKLLAAEQRLKYTTQEALLESEQRYRALFENSADGVAHTATDGRIFEMNPAFLEMVGYSAREVAAGEVHRNDVLDTSDPRLAAALAIRKRTGRFRGELNFRRKDGTVFPVELSTNVYRDADGNERTSMIARDMSEVRRIERQLQEYREQLAQTEQMSLVMAVHTSPEGYWLKVPPRLCELLGYSESELLDMTYQEITHPDDRVGDDELTRELLDGHRSSIELEKRFRCKDGSSMWAYLNVTLVRDRAGEALHFLTYIRDITSEKAARKQAEAGRARLQSVLEQSPALMATNEGPELVFTSVNEKYRRFFPGREILGRSLIDVLPELEPQGIIDILHRVRTTGESYSCAELPIELDTLGNGELELHYFNLVYQALRDHEGNITGVLANSVDITEQVRARKEAEQLHAHLRNAYESTIEGWARALDLKDEETAGHSQRVTRMTVELARRLGVSEPDLVDIRRGALLHDIGKMGVPDRILLKPAALNAAEWQLMERHTAYARDLLYPIEHLRRASDIPYCHHERWDGSGYPNGLSREEIPLAARIFAVVDVFDALTSDRPYRPAWSREEALAYIAEQSGKHFDPRVVTEFLCLSAPGGRQATERRTGNGHADADPASGSVE